MSHGGPPAILSDPRVIERWRMLLFSFSAGALIASLYFLHPLLADLAAAFGTDVTHAGYLITATQVGYTLGVVTLVPLGDVVDRRRLAAALIGANAAGLALAGMSSSYLAFVVASVLIGIGAAATMVIIPYVAAIAPDDRRGAMVAQVMTGSLGGVLLAWVVSGAIAEVAGWRAVYVVGAGAALAILVAVPSTMAAQPTAGPFRYHAVIGSLAKVWGAHAELRRRALFGALCYATFSALWTGLPILLAEPPYNFAPGTIGLFGLTGIAGALFTGAAGRHADRGKAGPLTVALATTLVTSAIVLLFARQSLSVVVLGCALLNIGAMALQVVNQSVIYQLDAAARARMTAIFISSTFVGASIGSAIASAAYGRLGWPAVSVFAALMSILILVVVTTSTRERAGRT